MSLYNMMHGFNPFAGIGLAILGLKSDEISRFRDCYLSKEDDGPLEIHVYTRMGGGNRGHWEYSSDNDGGDSCDCPGCSIDRLASKHPLYVRDYDDDFDCTYATYVFKIPDSYRADLERLTTLNPDAIPASPADRFHEFMDKLRTIGPEDPDVRRVMDAMAPVVEAIKKAAEPMTTPPPPALSPADREVGR